MFALRRAAVRAIVLPSRHTPIIRASSHFADLHVAKPVLQRSLHQSRRWSSNEEQKTPAEEGQASAAEAEIPGEIDAVEPSAQEQKSEVKEESIASSKVADGAESSQSRGPVAQAADALSNATNSVASAARNAVGGFRAPSSSDIAVSDRICYIGNLFFEVTASELEAEFAKFGTITNARVITDTRGQSKGFGYVEFENKSEAEEAIRSANQKVFHGRRMAVQFHQPKARTPRGLSESTFGAPRDVAPPSRTLFIGNMSYQMSDRDLNDLFREVRNVLDVRVAIDRRSGQPRGFAHADFTDVTSATKAKELLEQKVVYGRQLRVDYSRNSTDRDQSTSTA